MRRWWRPLISRGEAGLDSAVAGGMVAILIVVIAANVVGRMTALASLVWAIEFIEQLFPWIVFLGAAGAFRMRREIVVDSLFMMLSPRPRVAVMAIALTATCVVSAVLTVVGVGLVLKLSPQSTSLLGISLGWKAAALPAGMVLIFVFSLVRLIAFLRDPEERAAEIASTHSAGD